MATAEAAVLAIRHVVQEHGDERTRVGDPADSGAVHWFGRLLGWEWPRSYVEVLARHDGVAVRDAVVFRFGESIERFLTLYAVWHRPDGFWPVASDGCGNYFALAIGQRDSSGECPVVFFEMNASGERPEYAVSLSYADFVRDHMQEQCREVGCSQPSG